MSDEPPLDEAPPEPTVAPPKRSRVARIAILLVGLAGAAVILPRLPRERQIEFRVEDASSVVAINLAWTRGDGDGEPVQGGSWRFTPGQAPRSLTQTVHLPNGRYTVDVTVERTEGRDELHRVIELADTDHVTVPLR